MLEANTVKWQDFVSQNIAIPTPWEKDNFDNMDLAWQKKRREMNNRIAALKKTKAREEQILQAENEYIRQDRAHAIKVDTYLQKSKYAGKVGAFEGAGYASKGLYRPMLDCIMFSKGDKPFCQVCNSAVRRVLSHYLE